MTAFYRQETDLIPWFVTGGTAMICALVLIVMAALGPLGTGDIQYHTSQSGEWQIMGQDLADLFLIAPLLLIGGALQLMRRDSAKYFLILTPITLIYTGLSVGVGQEWTLYPGNAENYFWIYLALMVGGLLLLVGTLPRFTESETPVFSRRGLRLFVVFTALALLFFAKMWLGQITEVIGNGDLVDGSYSNASNAFWVIRYLDLGVCVPLGFLALFMLMSRPEKAYGMVLLLFGFLITMAVTVNTMAIVQVLNDDPAVATMGAGLAIFPVLLVLMFIGLFYLVRHKMCASSIWPVSQ
ncbi:MAG: hypothetical protein E4H30_02235 [Methanomassiliicoccus sp.]|nr:MAG: hypothetical protein E4H30_02235 [Methanomassiliicoccus sp.]